MPPPLPAAPRLGPIARAAQQVADAASSVRPSYGVNDSGFDFDAKLGTPPDNIADTFKVVVGDPFHYMDRAKVPMAHELRKMYFRPETRGLGLGHAMLELLLDEMRGAGFRRCYLETTSWMDRAQNLYRKAGFTELPDAEGATGHHGCDTFFSRML